MLGMVIGGIAFGILGDKKGRLSVLFCSILLYSVANILNGMVSNTGQYAVLRFIAGLGLAGELGAGLTLVSEQLPKEKRRHGSGPGCRACGILGAVSALRGRPEGFDIPVNKENERAGNPMEPALLCFKPCIEITQEFIVLPFIAPNKKIVCFIPFFSFPPTGHGRYNCCFSITRINKLNRFTLKSSASCRTVLEKSLLKSTFKLSDSFSRYVIIFSFM